MVPGTKIAAVERRRACACAIASPAMPFRTPPARASVATLGPRAVRIVSVRLTALRSLGIPEEERLQAHRSLKKSAADDVCFS
jgi:hypothetical protein